MNLLLSRILGQHEEVVFLKSSGGCLRDSYRRGNLQLFPGYCPYLQVSHAVLFKGILQYSVLRIMSKSILGGIGGNGKKGNKMRN